MSSPKTDQMDFETLTSIAKPSTMIRVIPFVRRFQKITVFNGNLKGDIFHVENVPLPLISEKYGTPAYVYSSQKITTQFKAFQEGFGDYPANICYAVKANPNLSVLNLLARLGAGFDIVSGGELARVIAAKGDPKKVVFSGVGKSDEEIIEALNANIACFNVESHNELQRIESIAASLNKRAPIACRINPNVDARTHPHITTGLKECKFGIGLEEAYDCYRYAASSKHLEVKSIACHIGSQITDMEPFIQALDEMIGMQKKLASEGIEIFHIDVGGGLGITYQSETPPTIIEYCRLMKEKLQPHNLIPTIACGRSIVAQAGILLTKVIRIKNTPWKNFAITDAGMNDFMRPALYNAWHHIQEVQIKNELPEATYDIVGSICESADFFGKSRQLKIAADDLIFVRDVGAYGYAMSNNYNSKPRAVELMIEGDQIKVIKPRETMEDLLKGEQAAIE